ncbi:HAMP domain-containing sensor histidine kinase [Sulfurimonas sp. HSL3-7]|uniref:sensor histidine kinase n=1 Tax=Sulfonitrofixus jiaomeiensis TaxID=3131938 RepID=UPI0031F8AA20
MSRVELESFLKGFLLFFASLSILITTLFYISYTKELKTLDDTLFSEMRLCSFNLKCERYAIDFVPLKNQTLYTLYKDDSGLYSYFPIPGANDYLMELHLSAEAYNNARQALQDEALLEFAAVITVVLILSVIFSLYAIYPLRNALLLTREFIKDILHDFNTPLAALRLNSAMLKREIGENDKITRIEQSVQNVLDLQQHLRSYLHDHTGQKELIDLKLLISERVSMLEKSYPDIHFGLTIEKVNIMTNRKAFTRIIDNLLTNAAKYNKPHGSVDIIFERNRSTLRIVDTGKGIKNPKRIFERFYKEQERGIGIGLHIVKKLSDELGIKTRVESEIGQGTIFSLDLSSLTVG